MAASTSRAWFVRAVLALLCVYVLYVIAVGVASTVADQKYKAPAAAPTNDKERAACVANALVQPLEEELDGIFGWLPNDILFVPKIIDNKTSYQRGVIYATRSASDVLMKTVARFGDRDTLPPMLVDATQKDFAYADDVWGWWFVYNTEKRYRQGIDSWRLWASRVPADSEAAKGTKSAQVYNLTTSDLVEILNWAIHTMEYTLGVLNDDKVGHFRCDDVIYYVKGISHVVDCVLQGIIQCDEGFSSRGGKENVEELLKRLDMISRFNPIYVVGGSYGVGDSFWPNHIAAMGRHVDVVSNRLTDIRNAMEK